MSRYHVTWAQSALEGVFSLAETYRTSTLTRWGWPRALAGPGPGGVTGTPVCDAFPNRLVKYHEM